MRCTGPKNVNGGKASVANWCIKTPLPFTRSSGLQNKSSSTLHVVARVTFLVSIGVLSDHATKPLAICIGVVTAALLQATRYNATNNQKLSKVKTNNSKKQQSYKQFVIPQSYLLHLSYQSPKKPLPSLPVKSLHRSLPEQQPPSEWARWAPENKRWPRSPMFRGPKNAKLAKQKNVLQFPIQSLETVTLIAVSSPCLFLVTSGRGTQIILHAAMQLSVSPSVSARFQTCVLPSNPEKRMSYSAKSLWPWVGPSQDQERTSYDIPLSTQRFHQANQLNGPRLRRCHIKTFGKANF